MNGTISKVMISFLLIVNTVLVVFLCNMVFDLRQRVDNMGDVATKSDLLAVAGPEIEMHFQDKCTGCHTEKRFADMPLDQLHRSVLRMRKQPGADIPASDVARIQASLTLFRSGIDFSEKTLGDLALMTDAQRVEAIQELQESAGNQSANKAEIERIVEAYKVLSGK